jgi:hypothetical protein
MARVVYAWLLLGMMSVLMVFRTELQSDLLFLDSLMTDLFRLGGRWEDWKLTPAPAYLPDMLLYAIAYPLLPGPVLRTTFVSAIQALLLAWTCVWLAARIRPDVSASARCIIVLLVAAVVLVAARSGMWLFFNSTNNHFAALLFSLLCTGWVLHYLEMPKAAVASLIVAGGAAATASTTVFVITFLLPTVCALGFALAVFRRDRLVRRRLLEVMALLAASQLVAAGMNEMLVHHDALSGRVPSSVESALTSVRAFVQATRIVFAPDNRFTFGLALFVLACFSWLAVDWLLSLRIRRDDNARHALNLDMSSGRWRYQSCLLLLLLAAPLTSFSAIASGGFVDNHGYRYFTFPICLTVLLWILAVDPREISRQRLLGWAAVAGCAFLSILALMSVKPLLKESGRSTFGEVLTKGSLNPLNAEEAVGACLDRIASDSFKLGAGIADFWYTRGVVYRASNPLYILPVLNDASPYFHMTTLGPLRDAGRYDVKPFNFIILRQSGSSTQFDLKPETVGPIVPAPERVVSCEGSDAEVWLYGDNALDEIVWTKITQFLFESGQGGSYQRTGDRLPGLIGEVVGTARIVSEGTHGPGIASYGPYVDLPAGEYRVNIDYEATAPGSRWDVGRFSEPQNPLTLASGELPAATPGRLDVHVKLAKPVRQVEARTWFSGKGTLKIEQIRFVRQNEQRQGN